MWIVLIFVVVIIFIVVKYTNNVANDSVEQMPKENPVEVMKKSEVAALFAANMRVMFNAGGEEFQWLMENANERMVKLEFTKQGILLRKVEVNRHRLKETGTYDVETTGLGFGASGYQDLPNGSFVSAFRSYIFDDMKINCPYITVDADGYVKLADNAKKKW